MSLPLDPHHLTPAASLNRVRVVDLPGLALDSEVKGKTGYELVSTKALARLVRERADELGLDPAMEDHALCLALGRCLASKEAGVLGAAEQVGQRLGYNLGCLLLTLKRGDSINRAAREEWDDSYWRHWGGIRRVWLGGGLVSGQLGLLVQERALAFVRESGIGDLDVRLSPYALALPLVGIARRAPPGCDRALALDFGSTAIKRAYAIYRQATLVELRLLPPWPTGWVDGGDAGHFLERMVSAVADAWRAAGEPSSCPVLISVAAYVQDGHPMAAQGGVYMQLRRITDNLQAELARRIGARLGFVVDVLLSHDGTAAAAAHAGEQDAAVITAVITAGTALGVGFPPQEDELTALSLDLAIAAAPTFAPAADSV